jgi:hypothetical protein
MEAIIFAASGVLIYKLWRGVQEGGPRTKAVEVRGIAERPLEPVAAQLPDASSTTTPAAQAEAVDSIMRAAVMPTNWFDANPGMGRTAVHRPEEDGRPRAPPVRSKLNEDYMKGLPGREHYLTVRDELRNDPAAARARALAAGAHYRESMKNSVVLKWGDDRIFTDANGVHHIGPSGHKGPKSAMAVKYVK